MTGELETEHVERLVTALEHERITGPVRAAHFAGKLAFWVAYFTDLAEEAAVRA